MIPKLEFMEGKLEDNVDIIVDFYNWNHTSNFTKELEKNMTEEEKKQIIRDKLLQKRHTINFKETIETFQKMWDYRGDRILTEISTILDEPWDGTEFKEGEKFNKKNTIIGYIHDYLPVYPRNIKYSRFHLNYNENLNVIPFIGNHEIGHFLFFKKFYKIFPELDSKKNPTYDFPNAPWILSELIAVSMTNEPGMKKILHLKTDSKGYPEFENKEMNLIDGLPIQTHFNNFYERCKKRGISATDIIIESYKEVLKYESTILGVFEKTKYFYSK
jgi:hypothetical protein